MRLIITFITSFILLIPANCLEHWEIVEPKFDSIYVIEDENEMTFNRYIINDDIEKSNMWVGLDCFLDIMFIDRNRGLLVGVNYFDVHYSFYTILSTEDGGNTWVQTLGSICSSRDTRVSFIRYANESIGFIFGNDLLISRKGGQGWAKDSTMSDITATDITFINDSTGWAIDYWGMIYKTTDGGKNWKNDCQIHSECKNNSLFFVDESTGWVTGQYHCSEDFFKPIFLRTADGGESWCEIGKTGHVINDFYFENKDHGWAAGVYYNYDKSWGCILETFNGGNDWDVVVNELPAELTAIDFVNGTGWAVGDGGLILKNDSIAITSGIKEDKLNGSNEPKLQNYPNPLQSSTIITYQIPASCNVELSIYDLSGRKVTTLANEMQKPDRYKVEWNAEGMNPGIYFCELKTGQGRQVVKMSIVR